MKLTRFLSYLAFPLGLLFIANSLAWSESFNRIVAYVNSEVITLHNLNTKIKELTGIDATSLKSKDEEQYNQIRRQVLDILIDEKIVLEEAEKLGMAATPKEVESAIENIKKDNGFTHEDLLSRLKEKGISYEKYVKGIKNDLEKMRVINFEVKSKIIITEDKINEYYKNHINDYTTEGQVRIASIFLEQNFPENISDPMIYISPENKEILSKLNNGENFGEIAKQYSKGPGAQEGGELGFINVSQLDADLYTIIEKMSPGDISAPIARPSGIQIIKLLEKNETSEKPVDAVKDKINNMLYQEESAKRYSDWIQGLRKKAYTKIIF